MKNNAIFINLESIFNKDAIIKKCEYLKETFDIFYAEGENQNLESLCLNVNASYKEYKYIVYINPEKKDIEYNMYIVERERYYVKNILDKVEESITLLEENKFEGLVTPRRDFLIELGLEQNTKWMDYYPLIHDFCVQNNLRILLNEKKEPICIENGYAIIKTRCIEGIEKLFAAGITSKMLNYIIPLYAQERGFLPAYICDEALLKNKDFGGDYTKTYREQQYYQSQTQIWLTATVSHIYKQDVDKENIMVKVGDFTYLPVTIEVPIRGNEREIRVQLCDGAMCVCINPRIRCEQDIKILHNGIKTPNVTFFLTNRPEYRFQGNFTEKGKIELCFDNISAFLCGYDLDIQRFVGFKRGFVEILKNRMGFSRKNN